MWSTGIKFLLLQILFLKSIINFFHLWTAYGKIVLIQRFSAKFVWEEAYEGGLDSNFRQTITVQNFK